MSSEPSPKSPLKQAQDIVYNDRRKDYGSPAENHGRTAKMWSAYLGREITARDVCMLNILQKVSRDRHGKKPDNLVDIAGYAENAFLVDDEAFTYVEEATDQTHLEMVKQAFRQPPERPVGLQKLATGEFDQGSATLLTDREFSEWAQAIQQVLKVGGVRFTQVAGTSCNNLPSHTFAWHDALPDKAFEALLTVLGRGGDHGVVLEGNVTIRSDRGITTSGRQV